MSPAVVVSLERLGREIEDAEFRLKLWRERLERASAARQPNFKSGASTWTQSKEGLRRVQRVISALTDEVEALKAVRRAMIPEATN